MGTRTRDSTAGAVSRSSETLPLTFRRVRINVFLHTAHEFMPLAAVQKKSEERSPTSQLCLVALRWAAYLASASLSVPAVKWGDKEAFLTVSVT